MFAGRILLIGIALKLAAFAATMTGLLSAPVLGAVDGLGNLALLAGAASLLVFLVRLARVRLLWRVRQQLILSYIFVGVIPALLLIAFFLLAGVLLFANIGSYLIQARVRSLIDEVRVTAADAARDVGDQASPPAVQVSLTQTVESDLGAYPGASAVVLSLPARCAGSVPVGSARASVTAGSWAHVPAPATLPDWVPCDGYATLLSGGGEGAQPQTSRAAIRAVAPVRGGRALVLDVPLSDALLRRIGEDTGTQVGGITALPTPNTAAGTVADAGADVAIGGAGSGAPAGGRLTDVLRWVAFVDDTDWTTGTRGTVGLTIGFSLARLYTRISATPLASLGNFSFGQLLLAGLLLVGALFLIIQSVAFVIGLALARSITGSVHELFEGTERVRAGDFTHKIAVHRRDQLGELAESFNTMTASIETLLHEREEKQRLEQELAIARQIQMSLLPQEPLRLPGIAASAHCEPAREVGGDYYDFLSLGPARAGILIADVAGKGTSAALYMAELKGVVHSLSRTAGSPRELLIEANRIIAGHLDGGSFITMTYAVIDGEQRTLSYARAGHCPLVYVRGGAGEPAGERAKVLAPSGMVLGLTLDNGEMFERMLEEETLALATDDVLVLFTDGVSEAMNEDGECWGEQRLVQLVEEQRHADVDELRERILSDIRQFCGDAPQHDDMTMLVLKVGPLPA